jgi:hypothetical protein
MIVINLQAWTSGGRLVRVDIALAILIAWGLVGVSSLLFYLIRRTQDLKYGFGTELFAILFAVDIAIVLGVIDPTSLIRDQEVRPLYTALALLLAVGTICAAFGAVEFERRSILGWQTYEQDRAKLSRTEQYTYLAKYWWQPQAVAWLIRASTSAFHLMWIVRIPKWATH